MKVLNFKLYADFAHFRPYYTTSSPITYTMLPPTTLYGILGAILGLEKEEYNNILNEKGTKVGIALEKEVKKIALSTNLVNTKGNYWVPTKKNSNGARTPTKYEFLKDVCYSIFVTMEDEKLLNELVERVKNHTPYYTISLGLAYLIADIKYIDFKEAEKIETTNYVDVVTSVNISNLKGNDSINLEKGITYAKERFVKKFKEDRQPEEYIDVLYSLKAEILSVKVNEAYKFGNQIFTFLT